MDLGTVSLSATGGPVDLTIAGVFNGSVKLALLPTGGGDGDVVVSPPFTLDTTAPTVSMQSPADGATAATADAPVVATFDEAMKTAGTSARVTVHNASDDSIVAAYDPDSEGTWSAGGTIWTGPTPGWSNGASLYVQYSGFEDDTGNPVSPVSDTTTWNFDVAAVPAGVTPVLLNGGAGAVSSGAGTTQDFTIPDLAAETIVFGVQGSGGSVTAITSVTIDPGGADELVMTERHYAQQGAEVAAIFTGSFTGSGAKIVRVVFDAFSSQGAALAWKAGSAAYATGDSFAGGGANPSIFTFTVSPTSAGDGVCAISTAAAAGPNVWSNGVGFDNVYQDPGSARDAGGGDAADVPAGLTVFQLNYDTPWLNRAAAMVVLS